MAGGTVLLDKQGFLATVTINRPEVMNAVTREVMQDLLDTFKALRTDEEVRVIILEGAGGHFTVGADMSFLAEGMSVPECYDSMKQIVSELILNIKKTPKPVICKVWGNAYGVGVGLALAGDFVIATENAKFCEVFVNLGVTLDGGASYFLPRLIGMVKARQLALLGDVIDGKTAASIGLIHSAVTEESLDGEVKALANILAAKSPRALANIKEALEDSFSRSLEEALEWEASHQTILLQSVEHKEIVQKFLESRRKN